MLLRLDAAAGLPKAARVAAHLLLSREGVRSSQQAIRPSLQPRCVQTKPEDADNSGCTGNP